MEFSLFLLRRPTGRVRYKQKNKFNYEKHCSGDLKDELKILITKKQTMLYNG